MSVPLQCIAGIGSVEGKLEGKDGREGEGGGGHEAKAGNVVGTGGTERGVEGWE